MLQKWNSKWNTNNYLGQHPDRVDVVLHTDRYSRLSFEMKQFGKLVGRQVQTVPAECRLTIMVHVMVLVNPWLAPSGVKAALSGPAVYIQNAVECALAPAACIPVLAEIGRGMSVL